MSQEPELVARFETDPQGNPQFRVGDEGKHYKVVFEIKNAPPDVFSALFELDPTYYDPLRAIQPDDDGKLVLKTTSYGDYPVKVTLRARNGEYEVREKLSQALKRARDEMPANATVDSAIADIKAN
jgi:hypothetical protein